MALARQLKARDIGFLCFFSAGLLLCAALAFFLTPTGQTSSLSLVLINGAFEHVLRTALGVPGIGPLLEGGLRVLRHANPVLKALAPRLMRHPRFPDLLAGLGFLSGPPPFFPEVLAPFDADHRLRLPMLPGSRSMNLSNAVSVVVFEAWRQSGFSGGG